MGKLDWFCKECGKEIVHHGDKGVYEKLRRHQLEEHGLVLKRIGKQVLWAKRTG
jgi:hypothetical protein